jgi:hypothetical protein
VHPAPHGVSVRVFEAQDGKGVAALVIDAAAMTEKPYLVGKMMDENGTNIGSYFGYFQRKGDTTPPISIARIQQQLSAGMRWSSIDQRLQAIETNIAAWAKAGPPAKRPSISESVRKERLTAARLAVDRLEDPIAYYMANAESDCDFPTLFTSRDERVVKLVDNPPQLRSRGFEIEAGNYSEIVQGQLRRNIVERYKLIDLWRDGLFMYIAPGDEDFLGWRMGGEDCILQNPGSDIADAVLEAWKSRIDSAGEEHSALPTATGEANVVDPATGQACFGWPMDRATGQPLQGFDLLLMTATKPSPATEIARAWRDDDSFNVAYFFNNRHFGITTFEDDAILAALWDRY